MSLESEFGDIGQLNQNGPNSGPELQQPVEQQTATDPNSILNTPDRIPQTANFF